MWVGPGRAGQHGHVGPLEGEDRLLRRVGSGGLPDEAGRRPGVGDGIQHRLG